MWLLSVSLPLVVFLYPFWRLAMDAFQVVDVLSGSNPCKLQDIASLQQFSQGVIAFGLGLQKFKCF